MFKKKCEKLPQPFLIVKYRITDSKYIPGSNESEGNKLFTASRDSREKAMVCSMRTQAVDTIIWKST